MERQTVLILDSQLHRGGILEQGLNSRGFNVFRTSRSREAAKLMQVLQPDTLILAWEGEGAKFYEERLVTEPGGSLRCVLMASGPVPLLRPVDATVDMGLGANELIEAVATAMERFKSGAASTPPVASPRQANPPPSSPGFQTTRTAPTPQPSFPLTPLPRARNPSSLTPSPASSPNARPIEGTEAYPAFSGNTSRKREWKGSLDKLDIARLFSILMRRQATGQLVLTLQGESRSIWLHGGTLLSAESNLPLLQMPELLVQDGIINPQQAQQYPELARPKPGIRLLELGLIQNNQVELYNRLYVEQVAEASFLWEFGTFVFSPSDDKALNPGGFEMSPLIIQGVREGYSRERLAHLLGGEDRIPQWFAQRSPENFLPLNAMEKRVISQIDGARSLQQLWTDLQIEPRVPCGLIYVLMILGYVTLQESSGVRPSNRSDTVGTSGPPVARTAGAHTAGASTPEVQMNSARPMYETNKTAPTPHSMPSLQQTDTAAARAPSVSYRAMPNSRAPARPVLKTALDLTPFTLPSETASPAQDKAAMRQVEEKHRVIIAEDYFLILEVDHTAGDMEIRRAYQRLKHSFSTDQFGGQLLPTTASQLDEIRQTIQEAYDVLGDPALRELYRQNLDAP